MGSWTKTHGDIFCCHFYSCDSIRSQFCICHDIRAVMTHAKLWHDWMIIISLIAARFLQDIFCKLISHLWNDSQSLWNRTSYRLFSVTRHMHWTVKPTIFNHNEQTSNGSWCIGIKGEMSGTVCVTFTWDMYIYDWCLAPFFFVVCSLL